MDRAQDYNNGPAEEQSGQYLWLAGALVGGFLILMVIILIGIILWKFLKNRNTSNDHTWAGPSPLADGNIQEEGNCMNSGILGRNMSFSHISISPIISDEHHAEQGIYHGMNREINHENFEEDENAKTLTSVSTIVPIVPAAPSKNANLISETKMFPQTPESDLNSQTFPPPPVDLPQEFPLPPPPSAYPEQEVKDNQVQTFPKVNSHQQDHNRTHEPNYSPKSDLHALHVTNNLVDQLPPPPPPDF